MSPVGMTGKQGTGWLTISKYPWLSSKSCGFTDPDLHTPFASEGAWPVLSRGRTVERLHVSQSKDHDMLID